MKTITCTFFVAGSAQEHTCDDLALLPQGWPCWLCQVNVKVCSETLASSYYYYY